MNTPLLNKDFANKVYDILISMGQAREKERQDFVYHHCTDKYGCMEWRFCGLLGFGGKYRSTRNVVTCYSEDSTPEREQLIKDINQALGTAYYNWAINNNNGTKN